MTRRSRKHTQPGTAATLVTPPPRGGRFAPLSEADRNSILEAAFSILERTGMSQCPETLVNLATDAGARLRDDGRLCFPRAMLERAIARAAVAERLHRADPEGDANCRTA